ncbi:MULTISPECIES: hypothetical protein [unclassified Pedobacter]|uniref:hypothetical protein n=1 Tax=unclassified Pedobacter TaxID=2628915 RepID=UPI00141FBCB3|nr:MULTISPECIES: hypothetical protein [unclassified Pedobacter]NII85822.1 hypothetical protein [Pedobacter sp. SG908]NMN39264.1 hypothetical protein [Pedobacter sp. SG918]
MKSKSLLGLAIALFFLAACKKDNPIIEPPVVIEKEDPLEYAHDSISYSIDGITYKLSKYSSLSGASNRQPYSKVDSIVNYGYYISGIKDSVLYSRIYGIYSDQQKVNVIFIKTYNKASMLQSLVLRPKDIMDLFTVGQRNYALDYGRDNIQNGVAISISDGFKTYGSDSFRTPPQLSADAQKNSKFEITSLKKLKSGTYVLEAKFNAMVYNEKNVSKKLENGYLRLVMSKYDLIL